MKEKRPGVFDEAIRLTLHETTHANMLAILAAMPEGQKAGLVCRAIEQAYGVDEAGRLITRSLHPADSNQQPSRPDQSGKSRVRPVANDADDQCDDLPVTATPKKINARAKAATF